MLSASSHCRRCCFFYLSKSRIKYFYRNRKHNIYNTIYICLYTLRNNAYILDRETESVLHGGITLERKPIEPSMIEEFRDYLIDDEKSQSTVSTYIRYVKKFSDFADGQVPDKNLVIGYKEFLVNKGYSVKSINLMLVALRVFFRFLEWDGLNVKLFRIQEQIFVDERQFLAREEYYRLCQTAEKKEKHELSLILQTICSTGIRVSELKFFTVEAVRTGVAVITLKGKTRLVFIPTALQEKLLLFAEEKGMIEGLIFRGRTGNPVNRSVICKNMKALAKDAGIREEKVYPHNLRHLFAREFYRQELDIAQLADVLGHSSINTTRIYMKSTGIEHRSKIDRLNLVI